ncbi:MAG: hypothetical protein K2N58_05345 [Treponemataceae bacterium]|nr:hypothetical protein [Treponemataceae bacterium]
MKKVYDDSDLKSIISYAQRLENKTIDEVNFEQKTYGAILTNHSDSRIVEFKGKGAFGNYLETAYFGKKPDNKSQADFSKSNLELKASPLKILSNYEVKVKERLVLNHFTFNDLDKEVFDSSHFKEKNQNILIVFYFYDKNSSPGKMKVSIADLWQCIKEDEFQIRQDWQTIVNKIHDGKAHEISEGDTLYLGACTKGVTKESSMQVQPHSEVRAAGRAFCFKLGYINHIYQILLQRREHRKEMETRLLGKNEDFEKKINFLYAPYLKLPIRKIYKMRGKIYNPNNKSRFAQIARDIIGLNKSETNLYEFNASGIQVKTIRVEYDGKMTESLSFKTIDFCEIVDEEWEESYFYSAVTSKFIFVIFKQDSKEGEYFLDRVVFWQIPKSDYDIIKSVWLETREKIRQGDYKNFVKIRENRIAHVRPHAKDSRDLSITPQGTFEKKKCFWINQRYIQENVLNPIYRK